MNHAASRLKALSPAIRVAVNRQPETWNLKPGTQSRSGFTLIELLVTITIIGIIAGMVFGAMARATHTANIAKTKSTIAKLGAAMNVKYESYRIRRVPVDPQQVLGQLALYPYVSNALIAAIANRAPQYQPTNPSAPGPDPLTVVPVGDPYARPFPSSEQLAFVRLLAIRELMKYEMPDGWEDFTNFSASGGPPPYALANTVVLLYPPSIARTYLNYLNTHLTPNVTPQQIRQYDKAECLYMIITLGTEDDSLGAKLFDQRMVGDADGDGLPEFQDSWPAIDNPYLGQAQASGMAANNPISWIRWAPGLNNLIQQPPYAPPASPIVSTAAQAQADYAQIRLPGISSMNSDLQPEPWDWQLDGNWTAWPLKFSQDHHDPFDPLKLDIPLSQESPTTPGVYGPPRGFALYPLIFSAGPDGLFEVYAKWGATFTGPWSNGNPNYLDPYDPYFNQSTGGAGVYFAGMWNDDNGDGVDQSLDNITNHVMQTR